MDTFPWSEKYSVGIPEIDKQHKRLFALVNDYFDQKSRQQSPELEEQILKDLLDYTRQHFNYEEELIRSAGYPYYAEHVQEHIAFFMQVTEFLKAAAGTLSLWVGPKEQNLADFLIRWLSHHIIENDQKYAAHIAKNAAGRPGVKPPAAPRQ